MIDSDRDFIGVNRAAKLFLLILISAAPAAAHPLPDLRFDRAVHVRLSADGAVVGYTLEVNDWTMLLDGKDLVDPAAAAGGAAGFAKQYAAKKAPLVADDLRAFVDGEAVAFRVEAAEAEPERDHWRFRFRLKAGWPPAPGKPRRFAFEDQTFEGRQGAVALTLDAAAGGGVEVADVDDPADLRGLSPLDLKPGDERRLRRASATFAVVAPSPPPPTAPQPGPVAASPEPVAASPPTGLTAVADRGLAGLFDTGYGLGVLLLLAFGFGAAHAFTPGHGKTLVAAYLVGERGTLAHAVALGLTTTLAHTGSVLVVAFVLRSYYGDRVPEVTAAALKVVGGLLIAAAGAWLFLQRVRGRADHVHLFSDHAHGPPPTSPAARWARVILLGVGGGLVPCWDAVLLLLVAISAGRLAAAVPLLVAFSGGLAAVLVGLGVMVVYAHRAGGRRFADAGWFRLLPVASAAVLVGVGLWFARDGVRGLFPPGGP